MKRNTYTWGLLRTTGLLWSKQCMQSLDALQDWIYAKICKIDQQVIINLFRSIKDRIVKSAADGPYLSFKWIDIFSTSLLLFGSYIFIITISSNLSHILDRFDLFWIIIKMFYWTCGVLRLRCQMYNTNQVGNHGGSIHIRAWHIWDLADELSFSWFRV